MITSTQNNQVKQWRKLHTKKERTKTNTFLIEGYHLVEEAWKSDWEIETVIVQEGKEIPSWIDEAVVTVVAENVFTSISQTETPQGIVAVVKMKEIQRVDDGRILLVDAVQDPGNLGTIIRTADAAGFSKIIIGKGTVDVYNDKVIRATQGALFHLPIVEQALDEAIPALQRADYVVLASALEQAEKYTTIQPTDKMALIVGNEGAGINETFIEMADVTVNIPIYGKAESLNVGIAAAILMYHMQSNR